MLKSIKKNFLVFIFLAILQKATLAGNMNCPRGTHYRKMGFFWQLSGCVDNDEMCRDFEQVSGQCLRCTWYSMIVTDAFAGNHCKPKWYLAIGCIILLVAVIVVTCGLTVFFLKWIICPKHYKGKLNKPFKDAKSRIEKPKNPFNYILDEKDQWKGKRVR